MLRHESLNARLCKEFFALSISAVAVCAALLWIAGCNRPAPSDQQLKEQAAETTQQVKQGAKEVAADAKVAAANAERKVDDIAAGVKEGLNSNQTASKPTPGTESSPLDINSASAEQLTLLPGISDVRAQRIINNRPYPAPHDLVTKGAISESEYRRISGKIEAR